MKIQDEIKLGPGASMVNMIDALWTLPRDLVSDGYDSALRALAAQVPMTVHEYPSGTECWTWIVPEKWTCREGYLETLDGRRLLSYEDNPLHVVSYSAAFHGEVSSDELFDHLLVHPELPNAVPYGYRFYDRDWGLCCSREQKDTLTDERYRVVIDSEFTPGTLKVGEAVVRGTSGDCIVLCAHLDHPGMVNDDLSGVVVGIEVMRRLARRRDLRYTYRLLVVPETIGSAAYLSHNQDLIPTMRGGLFLEMLGLDNPPALQASYSGDTTVDRCFQLAFREAAPSGWTGDFLTVIRNDERQFNSPGVRVPMLSLSRVLPPDSPGWPYPEYHSHLDDPDLLSEGALEGSVDLALAMIDAWEADRVPVNVFKGEVFLSRYGLYPNPETDPEEHWATFRAMFELDGSQSIAEIAHKLSTPFSLMLKVVEKFHRAGLVELVDRKRIVG